MVAANGDIQLAQSSIDVYYYGYVFDTGYEEYYYWYSAEDVIVGGMKEVSLFAYMGTATAEVVGGRRLRN